MQPITTLADLIALVESGDNQYAVRFEPTYEPKEQNIATMSAICKCNKATAKILCAMSFGLFQIMGDNLISLDLSITPFVYMNSRATQNQFFKRYRIRNVCDYTLDEVINDETKRLDFARKYNGPGNPTAYANRMMEVFHSGNSK